jgi:hypothetical protein
MRSLFVVLACALMGVALPGCAAIAIVDTAVSVTSTVVETTVDVAAGAVDAVAGPSDKDEDDVDCDDEENKELKACKKDEPSKP